MVEMDFNSGVSIQVFNSPNSHLLLTFIAELKSLIESYSKLKMHCLIQTFKEYFSNIMYYLIVMIEMDSLSFIVSINIAAIGTDFVKNLPITVIRRGSIFLLNGSY